MALVKLLLAHLILCSVYGYWGKATSISNDDSEIEAQLKILNKPAVKTFVTKDGETIDCVPIHKQPAFDHPLLKDHKIQLEPNLPPFEKDTPPPNAKSVNFGLREPCPVGTVPIPRVTKEDLIRARSIPKMPSISTRGQTNYNQHVVSLRDNQVENIKYGAGARMTVYNLTVAPDQFSSHNIWLETGPIEHISMIAASWQVNQQLNGDRISRLFTYWTGDGHHNGCYNVLCPGFVQIDREVTTNYPFYDTSVIGGKQYELLLRVEQDLYTANWWLIVNDDPPVKVGYWPKELFAYLRNGSLHAAWGGIGMEGSDGYCPPMGSGRFPDSDSDYTHAAYFRNMYWLYRFSARLQPSKKIREYVDKSNVYGLTNHGNVRKMGYTLGYGGQGGYCRAQ
ncbi:uncharacterized protein LOC115737044 [Rhodamnia argentea]|uniref:Uncharacterized protein LOC115737044 n=1 Tax=Rhodamnia argentea TaxID=178133 RepID=A0ABM3HXJ2_9MYRT|nr:uncharacterized protein LOC115737044 [Rhodamnia argentea]